MSTQQQTKKESAVAFFYANAGYGYDPANETRHQGRKRGARALAQAEEWAKLNLSFEWAVDDCDSSEFSDARPAWQLWTCCARGENNTVMASLGAIDFGRDGSPWGESYKRVIEAELALDAQGESSACATDGERSNGQRTGA